MIRVTYPNEGLYAGGQPRWEQVDKDGKITLARFATDQEAMIYGLVDSVESLRYSLDTATQRAQELSTYGIRLQK